VLVCLPINTNVNCNTHININVDYNIIINVLLDSTVQCYIVSSCQLEKALTRGRADH